MSAERIVSGGKEKQGTSLRMRRSLSDEAGYSFSTETAVLAAKTYSDLVPL